MGARPASSPEVRELARRLGAPTLPVVGTWMVRDPWTWPDDSAIVVGGTRGGVIIRRNTGVSATLGHTFSCHYLRRNLVGEFINWPQLSWVSRPWRILRLDEIAVSRRKIGP